MPSGFLTIPVKSIHHNADQCASHNAKFEAEYLAAHAHPNALCVGRAVNSVRRVICAEWSASYRYAFEVKYVAAAGPYWPNSLREYVSRLRAAKTLAEWRVAAFTTTEVSDG